MPDTRQHRGAHPEDGRLFAAEMLLRLRAAVAELSWLLSRGYPAKAALKLVGDRHRLTERQRSAVSRAACSDAAGERRRAHQVTEHDLEGRVVEIDGFNLLITVEAALSGGVLLRCRDGCLRDLASVHGSYRSVQETEPALQCIGLTLARMAPASVRWLLDQPISNSGRLAQRIRAAAAEAGWSWRVELVFDPDARLRHSEDVVVSSDSNVLDAAAHWLDAASAVVAEHAPAAWCLDLGGA